MALTDNQIAWWSFDSGSLLDTGGDGNSYDAVLSGSGSLTTTEGADGTANGAITMDGDQYLTATAPLIQGISGDFSLSLWFKVPNVSAGYLFRIPDSSELGNKLAPYLDAGALKLAVGSSTYGVATGLQTDQYYSLIVTRAGTTLKAYIDNVETVSVTVSSLVSGGTTTKLGYYLDAYDGLIGTLDNIGFWDRELTAGERAILSGDVSSIDIDEPAIDGHINPHDSIGQCSQAFTGAFKSDLTNPEIRVFRDDDPDPLTNTVQVNGNDWNTLTSQVVSGEVWSGTLSGIPKTKGWLRFEIRKSNETDVTGSTTNLYGAGYLIAAIGQSNPFQWGANGTGTPSIYTRKFTGSWVTPTGAGQIAFLNQAVEDHDCVVGIVNNNVGGTALMSKNTLGSEYGFWSNAVSTSWNYDDFITMMNSATDGVLNAVIWWQTATDACGDITGYKEAEAAFLADQIRTDLTYSGTGILPVCVMLGARWTNVVISTTDADWTQVSDWKLENFDAGLFQGVVSCIDQTESAPGHLLDAGYIEAGLRLARWAAYQEGIYTTYRSPRSISYSIINSTTTDTTIDHDYGTDFTPTSGIDSYVVDIGSGFVATTGVRTSATTVRLTHASGTVQTVACMYGSFNGTAPTANILKDNSALSLPILQSGDIPEISVIPTTVPFTITGATAGRGIIDSVEYADGDTATVDPGTVNITWLPVALYTAPSPLSFTAVEGENYPITGVYTLTPTTGNISLTANWPTGATVTINGVEYTANTTIELAEGTYSCAPNDVTGYTTPSSQNAVVTIGNTTNITFTWVLVDSDVDDIFRRTLNALLKKTFRFKQTENSKLKYVINYAPIIQQNTISLSDWDVVVGSAEISTELKSPTKTTAIINGVAGENVIINKVTLSDGQIEEIKILLKISSNKEPILNYDYGN